VIGTDAHIHHRVDYWDSYWIVQGLLKSELYSVANSTLQNFMDEIVDFGFIPNGGRIYYLNRSQPPMFIRVCIISISLSP
jgi:alpha,alpha-trehalase